LHVGVTACGDDFLFVFKTGITLACASMDAHILLVVMMFASSFYLL
jgi:hypothetical protein